MKLRYLALAGLLVITLGCFFPLRFIQGSSENAHFWFFPVIGILLIVISKEGPICSGRILGGFYGLLNGILVIFSMMDTINMPFDAGISIGHGGPIILLGSILACIGGFANYKKAGSPNFYLGKILSLGSLIIISVSLLLDTFLETLRPPLLSYDILNTLVYFSLLFSLLIIFISSIIIVKESRRTI